ncbi:MAG: alanine--tRNA ligase-related protein [Anaerolineales bacterium]
MRERRYYTDSYTRSFGATVLEQTEVGGHAALVLDKTYFYPTSGGQPHDTGRIAGAAVVDVSIRPTDGAILHVLAVGAIAPTGQVAAEIDWQRRLDHMQQHTGQHILSQAFLRVADAPTVGFHLSPDRVTIDLAGRALLDDTVAQAEAIANEVVLNNAPVVAWFPDDDELERLPLRKTPDIEGRLRVVAIGDFDYTACGGTHVRNTGELGQVKVIRSEARRGGLRVEFRCGWRALDDYSVKNEIVNGLAATLTCGYRELSAAVERLQADVKSSRRALRKARKELVSFEAQQLLATTPAHNGLRIVRQAWPDRSPEELRELATAIVENEGAVSLLGTAGEKAFVLLSRAPDVSADMSALLPVALDQLQSKQGGGQPHFAQGGGAPADMETVARALQQVEAVLTDASSPD